MNCETFIKLLRLIVGQSREHLINDDWINSKQTKSTHFQLDGCSSRLLRQSTMDIVVTYEQINCFSIELFKLFWIGLNFYFKLDDIVASSVLLNEYFLCNFQLTSFDLFGCFLLIWLQFLNDYQIITLCATLKTCAHDAAVLAEITNHGECQSADDHTRE